MILALEQRANVPRQALAKRSGASRLHAVVGRPAGWGVVGVLGGREPGGARDSRADSHHGRAPRLAAEGTVRYT